MNEVQTALRQPAGRKWTLDSRGLVKIIKLSVSSIYVMCLVRRVKPAP